MHGGTQKMQAIRRSKRDRIQHGCGAGVPNVLYTLQRTGCSRRVPYVRRPAPLCSYRFVSAGLMRARMRGSCTNLNVFSHCYIGWCFIY